METIVRSREAPHSLVQRAQIVLLAHVGNTNKSIAQNLGLCEETVGFWRKRWLGDSIELEKYADQSKKLREAISHVLADKPRAGCPGVFTAEQICQLLALACETPPEHLSHWTQPALVRTAIDRGIVDTISLSSIGRFLKSGGFETASH
nr:helix-turn-helix domain-containing protein [Methylomarinum sp. Ch1-1]MDP4519671.1 helix-turn-helix domain-containing protein [Methylomarinum sp. Ch1-1]MDP4520153.1 helix-turn-helix domain-containing protein [Methylomarinum sp. Ch1-1]MDP4520237.1 helix-turn-helix domain-containing protein [Methylomarinum sp. Ch1-1]MDP4520624.1 helix-turn-helix domain-containing protein [Methylomarinum sp. Ch1-1]MDP4522549.1 helix-turn-helix domain-containing protein [Methylomarinum sp. Ch1-1]